jgi:hypothetical protein
MIPTGCAPDARLAPALRVAGGAERRDFDRFEERFFFTWLPAGACNSSCARVHQRDPARDRPDRGHCRRRDDRGRRLRLVLKKSIDRRECRGELSGVPIHT